MNREQREYALDRIATEIKVASNRKVAKYERLIMDTVAEEVEKIIALSDFKNNIKDKTIEDYKSLCSNLKIDGLRFCSKCGKPMIDGFLDSCSGEAYCSVECTGMSEDEYNNQYSDENDCVFWTEWEI